MTILTVHSQLSSHIERASDILGAWRDKWMLFLRDGAPKLALILIAAFILHRIIILVSSRMIALSRREELPSRVRAQQLRTLASVTKSGGTFLVYFIAVIEILPLFDINIGPLLASAGVAGLAIGFGAQTLVKDVITGFFILFENQFDIGDTVRVAGVQGIVEDMKLRSTILRDANGTVHNVPNSQIAIVSNLTRDWNLLTMHVAIDYNENSDRVIELLKQAAEALRADPEYAQDLKSDLEVPGIERVSGTEVDYLVTAKVSPGKQYRVSRELRRRIKDSLTKNNIKAGAPSMIYFGERPTTN
ncbi:MAG: mechanosensitive ion channel family protein [Acidobacteriales bacterium]|nr:mechanosensitive ion channel family protein [Terriglobales bacterium]